MQFAASQPLKYLKCIEQQSYRLIGNIFLYFLYQLIFFELISIIKQF